MGSIILFSPLATPNPGTHNNYRDNRNDHSLCSHAHKRSNPGSHQSSSQPDASPSIHSCPCGAPRNSQRAPEDDIPNQQEVARETHHHPLFYHQKFGIGRREGSHFQEWRVPTRTSRNKKSLPRSPRVPKGQPVRIRPASTFNPHTLYLQREPFQPLTRDFPRALNLNWEWNPKKACKLIDSSA